MFAEHWLQCSECLRDAAGYKQDAEMTDEVDLQMAQSERDDVIRAAARIANALKDIYNDIGELPEVKARFDLVATDVAHYSGMEDCGL